MDWIRIIPLIKTYLDPKVENHPGLIPFDLATDFNADSFVAYSLFRRARFKMGSNHDIAYMLFPMAPVISP